MNVSIGSSSKMFYLKFLMLMLFFCSVKILFAVDQKKISRNDLIRLVKTYPKVMGLILKSHQFYANEDLGYKAICPICWCSSYPYNIQYGSVKVSNKKLIDVVISCFNKGKYELGYMIILNVLESVSITYIYRFCEYAREMNKRGGKLTQSLENFNKLLYIIQRVFHYEIISTEPIDFLKNIYKEYESKHQENGYINLDNDYRNDLLDIMNIIEFKINFVDLGTCEQFAEEIPLEKLESVQLSEILNAINLLFKANVEIETETDKLDCDEGSCIVCMETLILDDSIYSFVPCGHTGCCEDCIYKIKTCPLCRLEYKYIIEVNAVMPSYIFGNNVWDKISRSTLEKKKAQCVNCMELIELMEPVKKFIVFPCGHGLYCHKCISQQNCVICEEKTNYFMPIYI
ncbi:uncharacterized protein LOC126894362 [Daktulosphaira vitifoliae]|uniref:uncharacterized protein LOC126894362 n=1 Tax=Daktulosphaira vitifoliae TaxID=58002 RepID=UPI0021AAA1A3|nr:uncharacterized protein LOC126894362 [Daktulosphaira vitifoliae]